MKRIRAFTLLEMMVSMAVLGIITLYLTDMLVRSTKSYTVVDQVSEAQQNLRAIADLVERELRVTGFMVPSGAAFCGGDNLLSADVLYVTDSDAINPANQTQLNIGAPIAGGYNGGNGDNILLGPPSAGGNPLVVDGVPFYDNNNNGVADDDFLVNPGLGLFGGVIVADRANPDRGSACGVLTSFGGANTLNVDYTVGGLVGQNQVDLGPWVAGMNTADLVAIPAHVYVVNNQNQLFRDGVLLADDVEDLQFAAFYDVDGDGAVTGAAPGGPPFHSAAEYPGSNAGGGQYDSEAWDNRLLQELRVSFVVRTRAQDQDVVAAPGTAVGTFIANENRIAPAQPPDGFKRRVHTMTVRPRNIGARPQGSF